MSYLAMQLVLDWLREGQERRQEEELEKLKVELEESKQKLNDVNPICRRVTQEEKIEREMAEMTCAARKRQHEKWRKKASDCEKLLKLRALRCKMLEEGRHTLPTSYGGWITSTRRTPSTTEPAVSRPRTIRLEMKNVCKHVCLIYS